MKRHYTLAEVSQYGKDLGDAEQKVLLSIPSTPQGQQARATVHVMREIYLRMQENIRDQGPRPVDKLLERLSERFKRGDQ